jgi:hypothetical protein
MSAVGSLRVDWTTMRAMLVTAISGVVLTLAAAVAPTASADHGEPVGAHFGVADAHDGPGGELGEDGLSVDAPAFPDAVFPPWTVPKAFWTGRCDLEQPSTGGSGAGDLPLVSP